MPKQRAQLISKAHLTEQEFSKEFRVNQNSELLYILCHTTDWIATRGSASGAEHLKALHVTAEPATQTFIPATKKDFKPKLVDSFLSADLPIRKLRNPKIWGLFTNLGQLVPSESACRSHMETLAASEFEHVKTCCVIRREISKTKYLNVLVGKQRHQEKTFVVDCSVVESINQSVIAAKVDDTLWNLDAQLNNFFSFWVMRLATWLHAQRLFKHYPHLFNVTVR